MQCPKCNVKILIDEDEWRSVSIGHRRVPLNYRVSVTLCRSCDYPIVELAMEEDDRSVIHHKEVIYPIESRPIVDLQEVPEELKKDYIEASNVLPISAKASVALSRRVLQSILTRQGYEDNNLSKQVDAVLNETDPDRILAFAVRKKIDAIRNFGNFSARRITDKTTQQVIDVEPEEAEWCLEIGFDLFDHYFIRPAADNIKRDNLNQKLGQAGKPPVK